MYKMGTVQLRTNPDALGKTLWAANHKSIRARYGDYDHYGNYVRTPIYRYETPTNEFYKTSMDQALKMVHYYDYQTCEFSGYNESRAKMLIDKLGKELTWQGADWQAEGLTWGYRPDKIAAEAKAEKIAAYYEGKADA
jgi:hypothetical protein